MGFSFFRKMRESIGKVAQQAYLGGQKLLDGFVRIGERYIEPAAAVLGTAGLAMSKFSKNPYVQGAGGLLTAGSSLAAGAVGVARGLRDKDPIGVATGAMGAATGVSDGRQNTSAIKDTPINDARELAGQGLNLIQEYGRF